MSGSALRPAASRPAPADAEALPTRARPTPGSAQVPGGSTMVCTGVTGHTSSAAPRAWRWRARRRGRTPGVFRKGRCCTGWSSSTSASFWRRSRPAIAGLPAGVREGTVRGVPGLRSGPAGLPARAGRAVRGRDGGGVQLQRPLVPLVWRPPQDGAGRAAGRPGGPGRPGAAVGAVAAVVAWVPDGLRRRPLPRRAGGSSGSCSAGGGAGRRAEGSGTVNAGRSP